MTDHTTSKASFIEVEHSAGQEPAPTADIVETFREEAIAFLQPATFALHREFLNAIPELLRRRLVRRETPLLIGVRSIGYGPELSVAVKAAIEYAQADSGTPPSTIDVVHEVGIEAAERDLLTQALLRGHVVVLVHADRTSVHDRLLDGRLELSGLGPQAVRETLEREYGANAPAVDSWPLGLPHDILNLACVRCGTAEEAWELIRGLGEDLARRSGSGSGDPSLLDSLSGYGEALTWGRTLVKDIQDFRSDRISWSDVAPGALLVGPPGTGKSSLAGTLAKAAGMTFHPTSYAAWQSAGTGHLGDVTAEIARVFASARASVPALVFIDEIDSLPTRGMSSRHDDWWRAVVNALLEAIDGVDKNSGIVVLAACNDADKIDPALTRSGRLDRKLHISLPNAAEFARILAGHLGSGPGAEDLASIAEQVAGTLTGADAARIARDARRLARRAGRAVVLDDVVTVLFPQDTRTASHRKRVAVHEAGHVVVAFALGIEPIAASIAAVVGTSVGGTVRFRQRSGDSVLPVDLENQVMATLAGLAAETSILGSASTGSGGSSGSDLAQATGIIAAMFGLHAFGETLSYDTAMNLDRVEAHLRLLYAEVVTIVELRKDDISALAEMLVSRTMLSDRELSSFANERGLRSRRVRAAASASASIRTGASG